MAVCEGFLNRTNIRSPSTVGALFLSSAKISNRLENATHQTQSGRQRLGELRQFFGLGFGVDERASALDNLVAELFGQRSACFCEFFGAVVHKMSMFRTGLFGAAHQIHHNEYK